MLSISQDSSKLTSLRLCDNKFNSFWPIRQFLKIVKIEKKKTSNANTFQTLNYDSDVELIPSIKRFVYWIVFFLFSFQVFIITYQLTNEYEFLIHRIIIVNKIVSEKKIFYSNLFWKAINYFMTMLNEYHNW